MKYLLAVALVLLAGTAHSQFGSAKITDDGEVAYTWAESINDIALGYRCSDAMCTAQVFVPLTCEEEHTTPMMISFNYEGEHLSAHVIGECYVTRNEGSVMTLLKADDVTSSLIENYMQASTEATVIFPDTTGGINVARFDLTGSAKAMEDVRNMKGGSNQAAYVSPTQSGSF